MPVDLGYAEYGPQVSMAASMDGARVMLKDLCT